MVYITRTCWRGWQRGGSGGLIFKAQRDESTHITCTCIKIEYSSNNNDSLTPPTHTHTCTHTPCIVITTNTVVETKLKLSYVYYSHLHRKAHKVCNIATQILVRLHTNTQHVKIFMLSHTHILTKMSIPGSFDTCVSPIPPPHPIVAHISSDFAKIIHREVQSRDQLSLLIIL